MHNSEDIGRSKGGLSTKIHGVVDALGNPTNFFGSPVDVVIFISKPLLLSGV